MGIVLLRSILSHEVKSYDHVATNVHVDTKGAVTTPPLPPSSSATMSPQRHVVAHSIHKPHLLSRLQVPTSQFATLPCTVGYFNVETPCVLCASSPTSLPFGPCRPLCLAFWAYRPSNGSPREEHQSTESIVRANSDEDNRTVPDLAEFYCHASLHVTVHVIAAMGQTEGILLWPTIVPQRDDKCNGPEIILQITTC